MERDEKIQKLAKEIQAKIDKLKKLNCSITGYIGGVGLVDYNIEANDLDDNSDVVFKFDTAFYNKP